ncbi:MAG: hypothetical protein ABIO70_03980 [Pseudomonadota bacterium]
MISNATILSTRTNARQVQWGAGGAGRGVVLLASFLAISCGPIPDAPKTPEKNQPPPRRPLQVIALDPPAAGGGYRWEPETRGLVTALLEAGLSDLRQVAPEVNGTARSPGLSERVATGAEIWSGQIALGADPQALVVSLDLCDPLGVCAHHEAAGTREAPFAAVASVLVAATAQLRRQVPEAALARWQEAPSKDPYAILVCGRAAATLYGFLPPLAPEKRGQTRQDPFARAVFLDPGMHVAWWVVGRDALLQGEAGRAAGAFDMALRRWPARTIYQADHAAALLAAGEPSRALAAWSALPANIAQDPRFTIAWAHAALAAHDTGRAQLLVDALPDELQDDPGLVALQVELAVGDGVSDEDLVLLRRWARVAPTQPEPVEREIAALMDLERNEEAAALLPELERRGRPLTAATLAVPLSLERHAWVPAQEAARRLGWDAVAERVALRAELETDPAVQPAGLLWADDEDLVLMRATRWMAREDYTTALADAEQVLTEQPWSPGALLVASQARRALGDESGADQALVRLGDVDPEGLYRQERARLDAKPAADDQGAGGDGSEATPGSAPASSGGVTAPGAGASPDGAAPSGGTAASSDAGRSSSAGVSPDGSGPSGGSDTSAGAGGSPAGASPSSSSPAASGTGGAGPSEEATPPEGPAPSTPEEPGEPSAIAPGAPSEGPSTAAGATASGAQSQGPAE